MRGRSDIFVGFIEMGLRLLRPNGALGFIVADRWIGQRNAVVLGAVLMSLGHLAMAFDQSFLLALALLITGCGLLKGNISAQVGTLYAPNDEANRVRLRSLT